MGATFVAFTGPEASLGSIVPRAAAGRPKRIPVVDLGFCARADLNDRAGDVTDLRVV
jgi:hypothetical protein